MTMAASCETKKAAQSWEPKFYVGDHIKLDISRDQGKDRISCDDKKFGEFICMDGMEFKKLYEACLDKYAK